MYTLRFELPINQKSNDDFSVFLSNFKQCEEDIIQAISLGNTVERSELLEEYAWNDIVSVVTGLIPTPSGNYQDWTFWSLHKTTPRWGSPLFGLVGNEAANTIYLTLNIINDWTDEEDVGKVVWFKSTKQFTSFKEEFENIMSSNGVNYWIKYDEKHLDVYFDLL